MKATKVIIKLATEQFERDLKKYSWMKPEDKDLWIRGNVKELNNIKEAILTGRYYTRVVKVSASGMSRTIEIGYIKNNKLQKVSDDVLQLAGCDKNGRISGCGMDMLFAAQYNLFVKLCPNLRYQDRMTRYNDM